jgi:hypothetical protein
MQRKVAACSGHLHSSLPYIQMRCGVIVTITFVEQLREIEVPTISMLWRQQLNAGDMKGEQTLRHKWHMF